MFVCIALLFLFAFECFGVANRGGGGSSFEPRDLCNACLLDGAFTFFFIRLFEKTVLFLEDLLSGFFHLLFLILLLLSVWGIKAAKY